MAKAQDYLLTDDLDLQTSNGDFVKGASDQTASILLINTNVGSWKAHPFCGMGIRKYLGSSNTQQVIKRELIVQHAADGLKMNNVIVKDYSTFYLDFKREGYDD